MNDPYNLDRFVAAQEDGGAYEHAVDELRRGQKTSHWMWFVFPQIAGLGQSEMSRRYAISSLEEARAYLSHRVLRSRLLECAEAVVQSNAASAEDIFGSIDARKLHSSMTLFLVAAPDQTVFRQVLDRYYQGRLDMATSERL